MKHLMGSLLFGLLLGCSASQVSNLNNVQRPSDAVPAWGTTTQVQFVVDRRPVDGNRTEVNFELKDNYYIATKKTLFGGLRPDPQHSEESEVLANRLTCENQFADEIGTLTGVVCRFDARPVDGPLVEIIARLEDDQSGYELTQVVTPSGFGGNTEPVVTELGRNMILIITESEIPDQLNCVDTATFSDGPGIASLIEINRTSMTAAVTRTPVRLRGQQQEPSVLDENAYSVETFSTSDGNLRLFIAENVDTNVDWSQAGTCFKYFGIESFNLIKNEQGQWNGERRLMPHLELDPAVADCSFPHLVHPRPVEVACSALLNE